MSKPLPTAGCVERPTFNGLRANGSFWRDAALALVLTLLLTTVWAFRDWTDLSALILPDTDDMMRLQQVRDWIGGQGFTDLHQTRLGAPPGLEMHWSRLGDLGPAAIIVALTPLLGQTSAELAAVIAYPALLFFTMLLLIGRIALHAAGRAALVPATIMAAIAYPAITLFMPGRVDHHGLQMVLVLTATLATIGPATFGRGVAVGVAVAASLFIGFETIPFLAILGAVVALTWIGDGDGKRLGQIAFGLGLFAVPGSALLSRGPAAFCDAVSPGLFGAIGAVAGAALMMALTGSRFGRMPRIVLTLALGAATGGLAVLAEPACLSGPYGSVDAAVSRMWLANVGEAKPLLVADPAVAFGYAGLLVAGLFAAALRLGSDHRSHALWLLAALQAAALLIAFSQLRGVYLGALLAAPALAALVVRARASGKTLTLVVAWLAGAGILYPLIGQALFANNAPPAVQHTASCSERDVLDRLRPLPPGRLIAPIDIGAYAIGGTRHSAVAAPYHRNNAGNAAMYRFFLGPADESAAIAGRWQAAYVVICPSSFEELGAPPPESLLAHLRRGSPPAWLELVGTSAQSPRVYAIPRRLKPLAEAP